MNYTKFLISIPYMITWELVSLFRKEIQIDFLAGNIVDYICFKNIHELIPEIRIVARNKKVQKILKNYGVESVVYPTFPSLIIMARHLTRKFPSKKLKKIGMRHGAYHFKDFINRHEYNAFEKFFVTSSKEVTIAESKGIKSTIAVGFPKIDSFFNKTLDIEKNKKELFSKLSLDNNKKTILFTATWNKNGYSAIESWFNKLDIISSEYNILVTTHHLVSKDKIEVIKRTKDITYLDDKDIMKYYTVSDLMIGDISSIIAEFCAIDKPIITFRVKETKRFTNEIQSMLDEISYRIDTFAELERIIPIALSNPEFHSEKRKHYNNIMFDELDGMASVRAKDEILETVKELKDKV